MCTLIVNRQPDARHPLVIASNRDEVDDRPAAPPAFWPEAPEVYAPVDLPSGGTWIGVSRLGLVAAITDRDPVPRRPGRKSRGRLVIEALKRANADEAAGFIGGLDGHDYNGFHLLLADRAAAYLVWCDGERLRAQELDAGLHVITAYDFGSCHVPRATEIERRWRDEISNSEPTPANLDRLLNFHANGDPRAAACVHFDSVSTHLTRSSTVIRACRDWETFEFWHREGRACSGPFGSSTVIRINAPEL